MSSSTTARRRWLAVPLAIVTAGLAFSTAAPAQAERNLFFEETAQAFWAVPHNDCADGSTPTATLLVQSTRDFEAPETEDADPTARVQYLAVCDDGISFSWAGFLPATITSTDDLKSVTASGEGTVRDNSGVTHQVTFDVAWTAVGPIETEVNGPGSKRKERTATATGQVTFDGDVLVDGPANPPPGRPDPFIRVDTEK